MKKTRTLLAAAAAIAGLAAFAGPAQAAPPQPFDPFILQANDDLGGGYCSFPVLVGGFSKSGFKGPHDRVTGFTSVTVTNMDTEKKLTFNASGPGTFTNNPDGSFSLDASGPWLTWTTVENSQPAGVLQLAYTNGHLHYEVDENGNTQVYTLDGKSQDVCALLA
jgi:hypothetical protein